MKVYRSSTEFVSLGFKDESFSELFKISRLFQGDDEFWVDGFSVSSFNVFWSNVWDWGQTVFSEDLGKFADKWDAFSHTFNLSRPMLQENKLGKEQTLVQSCISSDSEDVGFVELRALIIAHFICWIVLLVLDYKNFDWECGK